MKSLSSMLNQFRNERKTRRRREEHLKPASLCSPAIERLEDRTLLAATLLQGNASRSDNRVDLVILGDGYTENQVGDGSLFANHVNAFLNYLFDENRDQGQDAFARYEDFFNVWRIDVVSAEAGADDPAQSITVNTALNASYQFDGTTQEYLYIDENLADGIVDQELPFNVDAELSVVLVNSNQFGGGGVSAAPGYAVFAGADAASREIGVREMGRAFSNLALENDDGDPAMATAYAGPTPPLEPNLSTSAAFPPWRFTWSGAFQPGIGFIGTYEGALGADTGIFRPSLNSKLRTLGNPFDAVSREAIIHDFYDFVDPLDSSSPSTGGIIKDATREFRVTAVGDNPVGYSTSLNQSINATTTLFLVADATGFPGQTPFEVRVDDEEMLVTGVFTGFRNGDFLIVQRGINGTTPAPHSINAEISNFIELRGAIDDTQTDIVVNSVSLFSTQTPFDIFVEDEQMTVTAIDAQTRTLTVTRGVNETMPVAHADGTMVTTADSFSDLFEVRWFVNGQSVFTPGTFQLHTERTLVPADFGFDSGFFTVSAQVTDRAATSVGWVRQGTSRLRETVSWTVNVPPVQAPTPVGPRIVAIDALPRFSWEPTDNKATSWELKLVDLTTGDAPIHVKRIQGTSFTPSTTLVKDKLIADHNYRWHVRGVDATGSPGDWTSGTDFTLRPNKSALRAPSFETTDTTPTFEWSPINGAIKYDIWVNDMTTGQSGIIRNQTVFSANLQNSINATTQTLVVTNASGLPLTTPYPIQIDAEQMTVTAVDGNTLTVTRGVNGTIRTSHSVGARVQVLGSPTFTPAVPLPDGHKFIWTVRPIYVNDIPGQWATHQTFQILGGLQKPSLLAPIKANTVSTTPQFEWTSVEGVDFYDIWVNNLTTGQSGVIRNKSVSEQDGPTVQYVDPMLLQPGHSYLWTVRGVNEDVAGPWGNHQEFRVTSPLVAPTLAVPNPVSFSRTPEFRWSAVPGAVRYDLWVNNISTGQSAVIREKNLTSTSFTPKAPLQNGNSYLWTVRAIAADGTLGPWAKHRSFAIGGAIPKPTLQNPIGTITDDTPAFEWTAITEAVRYDLWVVDMSDSMKTVIRVTDVNTNSFQSVTPLISGHNYIWTVRAIDADGNSSDWATHRIFKLAAMESLELAEPEGILPEAAPWVTEPAVDESAMMVAETPQTTDVQDLAVAAPQRGEQQPEGEVDVVMSAWTDVEWWSEAGDEGETGLETVSEHASQSRIEHPVLALAVPFLAGSRLLKRKKQNEPRV